MANATPLGLGSVVSLWRYPVKSMMGEELNAVEVGDRGFLGDRAYAVVDRADGKVASAKNPRKWAQMFDFRAAFADVPRSSSVMPCAWPSRARVPGA
jgi:hypothetical protein